MVRRDEGHVAGQRRGEHVVLGVHEQGQAEFRSHLHSPPARLVVDALKIVDPAAALERLEADDDPSRPTPVR
jgi:hypothetical protein